MAQLIRQPARPTSLFHRKRAGVTKREEKRRRLPTSLVVLLSLLATHAAAPGSARAEQSDIDGILGKQLSGSMRLGGKTPRSVKSTLYLGRGTSKRVSGTLIVQMGKQDLVFHSVTVPTLDGSSKEPGYKFTAKQSIGWGTPKQQPASLDATCALSPAKNWECEGELVMAGDKTPVSMIHFGGQEAREIVTGSIGNLTLDNDSDERHDAELLLVRDKTTTMTGALIVHSQTKTHVFDAKMDIVERGKKYTLFGKTQEDHQIRANCFQREARLACKGSMWIGGSKKAMRIAFDDAHQTDD